MKLKVLPVTDGIAWKSTKAQAWSTTVKEAGSGKERVLTNWAYPRWTIETSYSILTPEAGRFTLRILRKPARQVRALSMAGSRAQRGA